MNNDEFYAKKCNPLNWQKPLFYAVLGLSVVGLANSEVFQRTVQNAAQTTQETVAQVSTAVTKSLDDLFNGGQNSPIAIAVGAAEGTRTADGGFTEAYQGHTDPGNKAHNLGSFSYQHGATSPEEADAKQLERLKEQLSIALEGEDLSRFSTKEIINTADLLNQAPLAGYDLPEKLKEAKEEGLSGDEALVEARSKTYIDPTTGQLDAPGLGSMEDVKRDQARRVDMIDEALKNLGLSNE